MKKNFIGVLLVFFLGCYGVAHAKAEEKLDEAILAGGCFWCMETDLEAVPGVKDVVSGYIGGTSANPTYKNYVKGGHIEAVRVSFDPAVITYAALLDAYWRRIDPTDAGGQFCDRGHAYISAIFYLNEEQKRVAGESKAALEKSGLLKKPVVTSILEATTFTPAEKYHQDYHRLNPARYKFYRFSCGRDAKVREVWGVKKK